ncbi:hypothetical protein DES53_105341 [Roseimicrobium gellanilyticum]|uniref:Uncharacterized protein n=1 Tax=Roseimicrobium gellanilyticum TaxID=748857 RepID=A0A366HNP8_9BACT|nr:hypothetical protein [Roseimicrobium gellanilyticum]RBP43942.1 hypothetical protein DES53_105341 [Roseimicrobium gellanilyticum]
MFESRKLAVNDLNKTVRQMAEMFARDQRLAIRQSFQPDSFLPGRPNLGRKPLGLDRPLSEQVEKVTKVHGKDVTVLSCVVNLKALHAQ